MKKLLRLLASAATLAVLPVLLPATVLAKGPPVKVEIVRSDPNDIPTPGESFSFQLRLTSSVAATVQDVAFLSPRLPDKANAWGVVSIGLPPGTPAALQANVPLDIPCTLLANDPTQRVRIRFKYNGNWHGQSKRLLPRAALGSLLPLLGTTKAVPPGALVEPAFAPPAATGRVEPFARKRPQQDPARTSAEELAEDAPRLDKASYDIRVHGRFVYRRSDQRWVGVDAATVYVMDEDTDWDDELSVTITDANGYFDHTFHYDQSELPDIYLEIEASNARVTVEDSGLLEENYTWVTRVRNDTSARDIDYGEFTGGDEGNYPALHILTTATRCYRWYQDLGYGNLDCVEIQWPEDPADGSWYTPAFEDIHIDTDNHWSEPVIAHEFSHHWVDQYSEDDINDYCNDPSRCDQPDDCGHCLWCQETPGIAIGEGFPNWMGDHFCRFYAGRYGYGPVDSATIRVSGGRYIEHTGYCAEVGYSQKDDPWTTEGFFAAFLRDIEDFESDDESFSAPGFDALRRGRNEIVEIMDLHRPTTPMQFINAYVAAHPELRQELWATAANNGYQLDSTAPGPVPNLTSPSHPLGQVMPDHTVTFTWTPPPDDWSGVGEYSYRLNKNSILPPDNTKELSGVTSFTTTSLDTGTWYMSIRARDWAGNWSTSYSAYGPFRIREPYPADVRPWPDTGWAEALVPSLSGSNGAFSVPSPTLLTGNSAATYWNLCVQNIGELVAPYGWRSTVYLDGVWFSLRSLPANLGAGNYYKWNNQGPATVRGGRHMFSVWTDSDESHSELHEDDNRFARQWIWSPQVLQTGTVYTRAAPPDRIGGALSLGMYFSYNCDGLRSNATSAEYLAVSVRSLDNAADYDCRLHPYSTGATSGFTLLGTLANGSRPAGCLDAVLFRDGAIHDVGVVNMNDHWCDYVAVKTVSASIAYDTDVPVVFAADEYLELRHLTLLSAQTASVTLDVDPALGPFQLLWLDRDFTTGDLRVYAGRAVTDPNGHAEISAVSMAAGIHGFVIYRDPQDVPGGGTAPVVTARLRVRPTPCNLKPIRPTNWACAFVPRPANDGTPTLVLAPGSLPGDAASTYFNYGWTNDGPVDSPSYGLRTYVDGVQKTSNLYVALPAGEVVTRNSTTAHTIPAGRHALTLRLDPGQSVAEMNETDNDYGRQWIWLPPTLALRTPVSRAAPGAPTAGWAEIMAGGETAAVFNCDGLRMPAPSFSGLHGYWQAMAVMPGAASDVDPRLHETSGSAMAGFSTPLVISGWAAGQSDFVLVSYRVTAARAFDVGVVRAAGSEAYTAETVASTFRATRPNGVYGPYSLGAQHIIALHEVWLPAGPIAIGLHELAGGIDWGLSLHRGELPYHAKSFAAEQNGWISHRREAGDWEWLVVDVPGAGYYCLAVWKATSADLARNGQYELDFHRDLTGVPPEAGVPPADALVAIAPNPFNPQTIIGYDLAAAGPVRIDVYDVRGRRVVTLVEAELPPGRHQARWDGRDRAGEPVTAGTYVCRLQTRAGVMTRKLSLIK